jgi:hypothetical protein
MTFEERLEDIKKNPSKHKHDFNGLLACCMVNGAIDALLMEAHEEYVNLGKNGGRRCDVRSGPCSCGAWHR